MIGPIRGLSCCAEEDCVGLKVVPSVLEGAEPLEAMLKDYNYTFYCIA